MIVRFDSHLQNDYSDYVIFIKALDYHLNLFK